jgi:myo-inositol-1(or 4)-monophosphatase
VSISIEQQIKAMNDSLHESVRFMQRDFSEIIQLQNSKKGVQDFTQKCYTRLHDRVSASLKEKRPNYSIILPNQPFPSSEYCFVIEPISGINNFQHSIPFCCSVITLFQQNKPIAITIYNPAMRETFYVGKGSGAWFENYGETVVPKSRMRVSNQNSFTNAFIMSPLVTEENTYCNFGCTVLELAYLAAGRCDIVVNKNNSFIIDAMLSLIKESGAHVYSQGNLFFASNEILQKQAPDFLNKVK